MISWDDAVAYFTKKGDQYKLELLDGLKGEQITFYHQGNFTDLCFGPHIPSTGRIKAIKLLSVAGAYWRGNEKNKMLQRIYGITFPTQKELDEHLFRLEEAKRRDHRKLGRGARAVPAHAEGRRRTADLASEGDDRPRNAREFPARGTAEARAICRW